MTRLEAKANFRFALESAKVNGSWKETMRQLCLASLFFLLVYVLHREDADNDFCYDRCLDVQRESDDILDLWFREGYKSTIKTFARKIQRILADPEGRHAIFSVTRPIAKGFLKQIMREFETNELLKWLFDDVLYANPRKESPKWSEDDGIIVKRKTNPKEATVEAWGLVDAMPTSRHYTDPDYDDTMDERNSTSPEMQRKAMDAVRLSFALGTTPCHRTFSGTRYHMADAYGGLIKQGSVRVRLFGPTKSKADGSPGDENDEPWLWTREQLAQKVRDMGPRIAAAQLWQNPKQDSLMGFKEEWLEYWPANRFVGLNIYILCDPANEKKKENDYTVFIVIGLGSDRNYYVIDMVRDRLSLVERANVLFTLHQTYQPRGVGYERYGMQADIGHYRDRMKRDNYRFGITELGGTMPKYDRIRMLLPIYKEHRMYLPERCVHRQYDGTDIDVVKEYVEQEYIPFPFPFHDDAGDCLARILDPDLGAVFPQGNVIDPLHLERPAEEEYNPLRYGLERR